MMCTGKEGPIRINKTIISRSAVCADVCKQRADRCDRCRHQTTDTHNTHVSHPVRARARTHAHANQSPTPPVNSVACEPLRCIRIAAERRPHERARVFRRCARLASDHSACAPGSGRWTRGFWPKETSLWCLHPTGPVGAVRQRV